MINAGGNGEGKTFGLVAIIGALMWPALAPKCFAAPTFSNFKHPKKVWIVSNPAELGKSGAIQAAIDDLWPKKKFTAHQNGRNYNSMFVSDTGWVVELKSTDQNVTEFRGASCGLIAINEPLPEDIYRECLARTRRGGIVIGAMTSLDDEPWIVDGLLGLHDGKDYRIVYGNVEENCKDHTPGGTLAHDQIERILSKYPEDEREARRSGKPLSLSGRIFKSFDESIHVVPDIIPPDSGVSYGLSIDPAIGKPMYILFRFVDAVGVCHYYDEYPSDVVFQGARDSNLNLKDYVEIIQRKMSGHAFESLIIDRHFAGARRNMGGRTFLEEFQDHFPDMRGSYSLASDEIETGINKIKEYLACDKTKEIDGINRPRIRISRTGCPNLISSLNRWSRDPKTAKPRDEFKDPIDALRYDVMSNPEIETRQVWNTGNKPFYGVQA